MSKREVPETKEITRLLSAFISFETTASNPQLKLECLDWVQETFLRGSPKPRRGEIGGAPYLYLPHRSPKLLWFGHTDVVPGSKEQFSLKKDGKRAYGRGVKDMKGACLSFLMAYRDAIEDGESPPISILLTSDEETAGDSIPALLSKGELKAPVAFTPDTGTSPGIVIEHKAALWAELVISGRSGHGAIPWESDNPNWKLAKALNAIAKAFPIGKGTDWRITVTPTVLHAGSTRNAVPSTATCSLDIRYPPEDYASADDVLHDIRKLLPKDAVLNILKNVPPLNTDKNHPMVTLIKSLAEEITGKPAEFLREHGSTDARNFTAVGIPAFLYGPEGGDLHGENEWVSLTSLQDHYLLYRKLFPRLTL